MAVARQIARHSAVSRLRLAISLPLRDESGLQDLLGQIYDPASSLFRQYLTVEQFTQRFGPTQDDYRALVQFARNHGLKVEETYTNRMVLDVSGQTSDIENAFYVRLNDYQRPDGSLFYAPDQDPSLDLNVPVVHVAGLDNEILPKPRYIRFPPPDSTDGTKITSQPRGGGSGPSGSFRGSDYRNAYVPGVALTGTGQSVGVFELAVYWPSDVTTYESQCTPVLNVPVSNVYLDSFSSGTTAVCGNESEVALDIEQAMAMAPGLTQVVVYMGNIPINLLTRIASDNTCKQISSSWGYTETTSSRSAENNLMAELAAQGQSYFLASGDGNPSGGTGDFTTDPPYVDPTLENDDELYQTLVGANQLTMTSGGSAWFSEVAMPLNNGSISPWQSTGGYLGGSFPGDSLPSYQTGLSMAANFGSTTYRNLPNVSMVGLDCYVVDCQGQADNLGGTSAAAPLWAGFTALINQQLASFGKAPIGFANPTLYRIARGPDYNADFHDITSGNNGTATQFPAVTGYDLATGWGSPKGLGLINDFLTPTPTVTLSLTPTKTLTPTITPTPTITNTPTITYTPTITPTVSGFYLIRNNFNVLTDPPLGITYILDSQTHVDVKVYGVSGSLVRTVFSGDQPAGQYVLPWDGKDDNGQSVETGLYLIAFKTPGSTKIKKVLAYRR